MQATVARKPNHRGEHEVSRNPTAQGGRLTRLNLWRLARALKRCRVPGRLKRANGPGRFTAFGAAGAAGTRSPCALFIEEGCKREANLGQIVSRERGPAPEQPERFLVARMPQAARAMRTAQERVSSFRLFEIRKRIDDFFSFVIPGHRKAMGPESILPVVAMDSGPRGCAARPE